MCAENVTILGAKKIFSRRPPTVNRVKINKYSIRIEKVFLRNQSIYILRSNMSCLATYNTLPSDNSDFSNSRLYSYDDDRGVCPTSNNITARFFSPTMLAKSLRSSHQPPIRHNANFRGGGGGTLSARGRTWRKGGDSMEGMHQTSMRC